MSRLKDRLIAKIKAEGPITVAEYMTLCLLDPVDGYYPTRDPPVSYTHLTLPTKA